MYGKVKHSSNSNSKILDTIFVTAVNKLDQLIFKQHNT